MMKRLLLATLLLSLAAPACTHNVNITTPDGFAVIEGDSYDYRAANAEGVVLAVRRNDNDPRGDLAFWSGALDAHLQRQGYAPADVSEVQSADGVTGKQATYSVKRNGRTHIFWVVVFVTSNDVVTVEAGGDEAFFQGKDKAIGRALRSLKVG